MKRVRFSILLLHWVLTGCSDGFNDRFHDWEVLPPTTLQIPYKEVFGIGSIQISIDAIPNRPDAVKAHAYLHGCRDSETKDWVQEGTGNVVLVADQGKEKCIVTFLVMSPGIDSVREVRLCIRNKWKSGPR